jgi:PAS domain S-box-containing protein
VASKPTYEELEQRVKELEAAETKDKKSEEAIHSLFDLSIDMLCLADIDGYFRHINQAFEKTLGYSIKEILEQPFIHFVHPDDVDSTMAQVKKLSQNEAVVSFENRYRCKDGSYKWLSWTSRPNPEEGITYAVARDITERKLAEGSLRKQTYELGERIKELDCLYGISHLVEEDGISLEKILQATADLLPPAWQYSEITCARITVKDQQFKTQNFRKTTWNQSEDIFVHSDRVGVVEVYYLEEKPEIDEGPFLKEERKLIDAVGKRLGRIIERRQAGEALSKAHDELKVKSHHLQEVNTALRVLLKQREDDKEELQENVLSNVKELVTPHLERLKKSRLDVNQTALVSILESNINSIVSPFIRKLSSRYVSLTPMEIRVADFIKEGRTNKEIGELLFLSPNTVKFHRYNVRTKLGLKNKKMNLRSYLLSFAK